MPSDKRKAAWIKKYGECKSVKEWLTENPPPEEFTGTPQEYAFDEMPDEPIDDPLEPDFDEFPEGKPITRKEADELREQVRGAVKGFNRAIKKRKEIPPPPPPPPPTPTSRQRTGLASIFAPLARKG